MASNTINPNINIDVKKVNPSSGLDGERENSVLVKLLLSDKNVSSNEGKDYPSTTKEMNQSRNSTPPIPSNEGKNLMNNKSEVVKNQKVFINNKVNESISDDEVFHDCEEATKYLRNILLSTSSMVSESSISSEKKCISKSLTSNRGSHYYTPSEDDVDSKPSTSPKHDTKMKRKEKRFNQKKVKSFEENKENVNREVSGKDLVEDNVIGNNNSKLEASNKNSNVNVQSQQGNGRKKSISKKVKKYQNSINNKSCKNDGGQSVYYKRSTEDNVSSSSIKSKSPKLPISNDYFAFDGTSPEGKTKNGKGNSNKYHKEQTSEEEIYNEYGCYNNYRDNKLYKELGPLPSWDEVDELSEIITNDSIDYMEILESEFKKNAIPYFILPSLEVKKIEIKSGGSIVVPTNLKLPLRPITISTSLDTLTKSPTKLYTDIQSPIYDYTPYTPPYTPQSNQNIFFGNTISIDQIKSCILRQIEYYLSEENLSKDYFLQQNIDKNGFISLPLLASFPKIKKLTNDIGLVIQAMKSSTVLEMSEDYQRIKRTVY
uniref:HTH La-type RNA-binding domain-containing protein n=1 Tax=Strongyloides stercoralis TaxID=6248 RepID=A0A0K0EFC1_STRER